MINTKWSYLNHLQLGRFAEYFVKMAFTSHGFMVFGAEVDDRGVDFIIKSPKGHYYEIQVKSSRGLNYVFASKDKFNANQENLLMLIVLFSDGQLPSMYVIPARHWLVENDLLKSKDYIGLKSKPEWGINLSQKNLPLLEEYHFGKFIMQEAL